MIICSCVTILCLVEELQASYHEHGCFPEVPIVLMPYLCWKNIDDKRAAR